MVPIGLGSRWDKLNWKRLFGKTGGVEALLEVDNNEGRGNERCRSQGGETMDTADGHC